MDTFAFENTSKHLLRPTRAASDAIALLHRVGGDGSVPDREHGIVFASWSLDPLTVLAPGYFEGGSGWRNLATVRAGELQAGLELLDGCLHVDAYFSLNGFLAPRHQRSHVAPALLTGERIRTSRRIRRLTSCFVDLDVYNRQLSQEDALRNIDDLVRAGRISAPSMYCDSGRGLWCFWLLADPKDPGAALRSSGAQIRCWNRVQQALAGRFCELGVDTQALDVSRVARVPGSINSKSGSIVRYWLAEGRTEPRTYQLNDLADALGVAPVGDSWVEPAARPRDAARRLHGLWGELGRALLDLQRLESLECRRGGFRKGMRGRACALLASFLVVARDRARQLLARLRELPPAATGVVSLTDDQIRERVVAMADRCEPGDFLPAREARNAVRAALKGEAIRRITHQRLAEWLEVTPDEAVALRAAVPARRSRGWPCAARFGAPAVEKPESPRAVRQATRRAALREVLGEVDLDPRPSLRTLQASLRDRGFDAALSTIAEDLQALAAGRPHRPSRTPMRSLEVPSRGIQEVSEDRRSASPPLLADTTGQGGEARIGVAS